MTSSSQGTSDLYRARAGWVSPFNVMPWRACFNMVLLGFSVIVLRYSGGDTAGSSNELRTLASALAVAPVVWFLVAQPPLRRGAAATIRFLLGLVLVGGVVVYALSDRSRWMTVMTIGVLIGPAVAFAVAHGAVRRNREETAERRHRELVEAAARASEPPRERLRGSVRSRARRKLS